MQRLASQPTDEAVPPPRRQADRDRRRRDLLLLLLLLLGIFACLLATAQIAITPVKAWQVSASMLSGLNPDADYNAWSRTFVEPLVPEVLTPPAWDLNGLLTPARQGTIVPPVVLDTAPGATVTPRSVAEVPTSTSAASTPEPTSLLPTETAQATDTPVSPSTTPQPIVTAVPPTVRPPATTAPPTEVPPTDRPPSTPKPTRTPVPPTATATGILTPPSRTPTPTSTATNTPVFLNTFTPTPTSTSIPSTDTPTPTNTSAPPTATDTPTPTPTTTSAPPTDTSTPTPTNTSAPPTDTPTPTPTNTPAPTLHPILNCIVDNGDGTFTAFFGYTNDNTVTETRPIGPLNRFVPDPADRGQPTTFLPGTHDRVFSVVSTDNGPLHWSLERENVIANTNSPLCPAP